MANFERKVRRNIMRREIANECNFRSSRPARVIGKVGDEDVVKSISINTALGDRWRDMRARELKRQVEARKRNQLKNSNVKKKKGLRLFGRRGKKDESVE